MGFLRSATVAIAVLAFAGEAFAQTRFVGDSPTRITFGQSGFSSAGRSIRATRVVNVVHGGGLLYGGGFVASPFGYYGYNNCYGPGYGYGPGVPLGFCSRCRGYGSLCNCFGPVVLPPVVIDAGRLYGPRALMSFQGVDGAFGFGQPRPRGNLPAAAPPALPAQGPVAGIAPPARRVPAIPVGGGARGRAWKFIDHGDRHFKAARYREALSRYKKAITSSPELAAARFREGFAHLALGNLDRAALSIRRGLQRDAAWPESEFVLDDLFADDAAIQNAYKRVAEQLRTLPNDSEARLLAGLLLHFDGQPNEAARQFRRVIAIAGVDPAAQLFLPKPAAEEPAEAN